MIAVDFAVTLSGPSVVPLWSLFWQTLTRFNNLDGVTFHLVNKDVGKPDFDLVAGQCKAKTYSAPYKAGHCHDLIPIDVAETCDYMVKECGRERWLCISHFDIWFKKDWLSNARRLALPGVAMIRHHCPIMLLNREAYRFSKVKFSASAVMDNGLQLEDELRSLGWKVESFENFNKEGSTHEWFHHIGGGGSYGQDHADRYSQIVSDKLAELNKPRQEPNGVEQIDQYGQTRTLIHYVFRVNPERIACTPNRTEFASPILHLICHRSNAKAAVTCQACKATEVYRA